MVSFIAWQLLCTLHHLRDEKSKVDRTLAYLRDNKKILFMQLGKQHKHLTYFNNTRFLQKMDQFKLIFVSSLVVVHRIWKVTLVFLEKTFKVCFIFAFFVGV